MGHAGTVLVRIATPLIGGYLLGSIPTAVIIGRRRHVDLRAVGDRNPGWWNAKEELGRRAALPVLVVDVAKGAAGAAIGRAIARPGEWWLGYIGGAAAMIGHAWPLFARFRGGRSVATLGGAAGVLSPAAAALAVGTGVAVGRAVGSSASGIRAGFGAYPVTQVVIDGPVRTAATGGLMSIVGVRFWLATRRA
jgi:acyl phosphate:glycerol-3-phosphate acyltransferase